MKALVPVFVLLLVVAVAAAQEPNPASPDLFFSRTGELRGDARSPAIGAAAWRQALHDIRQAAPERRFLPDVEAVRRGAWERAREGFIPVAVLDERFPADAERGEVPLFAAAALHEHTYRGGAVRFVLDRERYITGGKEPDRVEIDFGDGLGFREVSFGRPEAVRYPDAGRKKIGLRAIAEDGAMRSASFFFTVRALETPLPHDTLFITATEPYLGQPGTGEAYVYLSDSNAVLTNPIVVIEGFDLDNTMNWDELYTLLNQEALVETLRADGYDAVVLNFTEATDYMQRNAYVVVELLEQIAGMIAPEQKLVLIGASMGGIVSRYALAWMESEAVDHRVRTFLSFDAPHKGANIPLGMQYWLDFFSDLSTEAEYLLGRLDTPAARQLLAYHHTDPPGATGEADSLRPAFQADLAAVGDWPLLPRRAAIINGSGQALDQGFAAGDPIIEYEYDGLLVDITGNVWAVPDGGSAMIFDGRIRIWPLSATTLQVTVSGTAPYDNAPGGYRASMAEMDSTEAPYGDIVALHPNHCFIPTVSSLALDSANLFFSPSGDPDLLDQTPFDAVYYPEENQEHVAITPESAQWFLGEVRMPVTSVAIAGGAAPSFLLLHGNRPNPFNPSTTISFELPAAGAVRLAVYDPAGRLVRVLLDGGLPAGAHTSRWNGLTTGGRPAPSGLYFCRLESGAFAAAKRMILIR